MRSAAGRTAAARSRSAGMPRGRAWSRSFITRGLADSYRAELICAARKGLDFSPGTGEPASWATPEPATISWLEHAAAYAAMKWPLAAAHTRAGIADALATITPALLTPGRGRPPAAVLRTALYGHAFNPARAGTDPGPSATAALAWARHHCLPLTALADPRRDPARAGGPGPAPGWDPGSGHDHHPQAGCLPRLPRLRGRTRAAGGQPSGPHHLAAPEIVLPGRPAVSGHPCRGAGDPGRGHPGSAPS